MLPLTRVCNALSAIQIPNACGFIHWDLVMFLVSPPLIFDMLLSHCVTLFAGEPFSPIRALQGLNCHILLQILCIADREVRR